MVSTASLLGARHVEGVVENKPASSLVVFLGKALNGTPPPLCGRQVAQTPQMARRRQWQTTTVSCQENFISIRFMNIVHKVTRSQYRLDGQNKSFNTKELNKHFPHKHRSKRTVKKSWQKVYVRSGNIIGNNLFKNSVRFSKEINLETKLSWAKATHYYV